MPGRHRLVLAQPLAGGWASGCRLYVPGSSPPCCVERTTFECSVPPPIGSPPICQWWSFSAAVIVTEGDNLHGVAPSALPNRYLANLNSTDTAGAQNVHLWRPL
jgi:hypothetical protein